MSKRFKRFFALPVIAALTLQLVPGVPLMKVERASAKIVSTQKDYFPLVVTDKDPLSLEGAQDILILDEGKYSKLKTDANFISAGTFDLSDISSGNIVKVELGVRAHYELGTEGIYRDDELKLDINEFLAGTISPQSVDETQYLDVSNIVSSNEEIAQSVIKAEYDKVGTQDNIDILVDAIWLRVTTQEEIADPIEEPIQLPEKVQGLAGEIFGGKAALSWTANAEEDLGGYNIYVDSQSGVVDYTKSAETLAPAENSWISQELLLGNYKFGITAFNEAGESQPTEVEVVNSISNYPVNPGIPVVVNNKIELIGGGQAGNVTVSDLGTDVKPALENSIKVFGHYYSFNADNNPDLTAIFPVMLKFYFTKDELTESDISDSKQLNGVYFYNSITNKWELYDETGVVAGETLFQGQQYDGYVWVNANHFTPVVTGADTTAPISKSGILPSLEANNSFEIAFEASDQGGQGLDYAELYYRVNEGIWQKYTNDANPLGRFLSSPIQFTASQDGSYEFYIIAVDKAGNTEVKEAVAEASTNVDTVIPGQVLDLKMIPGDGKVILSWNPVSGADGYVVTYSSLGGQSSTIDVGNLNQVTIIGLDNGKEYTFSVNAYRASNRTQGQVASIQSTPIVPVRVAVSQSEPIIAEPETPVAEPAPTQVSPEPSAPAENQPPVIDQNQTPQDQGEVKGAENTEPKNWTNVIIILSLLVILAAAVAGYYSYQWWTTKPKKGPKTPQHKPSSRNKDRW